MGRFLAKETACPGSRYVRDMFHRLILEFWLWRDDAFVKWHRPFLRFCPISTTDDPEILRACSKERRRIKKIFLFRLEICLILHSCCADSSLGKDLKA